MTVIGYTRVSTEEQGRSGLGLEAQAAAILKRYPDAVLATPEVGSGSSLEGRDILRRVLAGMERGDVLAVAKVDRIARNTLDFCTILERARKERWTVDCIDLGIDTSTAVGEAMAEMLAVFGKLERRFIAERSSRARLAKLARDPQWTARQADIYACADDGLSQRQTAARLGLHKETVARALGRRPPQTS